MRGPIEPELWNLYTLTVYPPTPTTQSGARFGSNQIFYFLHLGFLIIQIRIQTSQRAKMNHPAHRSVPESVVFRDYDPAMPVFCIDLTMDSSSDGVEYLGARPAPLGTRISHPYMHSDWIVTYTRLKRRLDELHDIMTGMSAYHPDFLRTIRRIERVKRQIAKYDRRVTRQTSARRFHQDPL